MKIIENEYCIDIFPYINEEEDDIFQGRITVHRNLPDTSLNGIISMGVGGHWLHREKAEQLIAGLQKAVDLSKEVEK
jgi:hypothetical protein